MPRQRDNPACWFTLKQVAAAFGMLPQSWRELVRPLLKEEDYRAAPRPARVYLRGLIDAWCADRLRKAGAGEESAARDLKRQRDQLRVWREQVDIDSRRLRLEKERGRLIPQADVVTTYELLATALRLGLERLRAKHGAAAAAEIEAVLADLETRLLPAARTAAQATAENAADAEELAG